MIARTPALAILLVALATVTVSMAHATTLPQISLTNAGESVIDLAWEDKDRMVRAWAEFYNFNPNDGAFNMYVIQVETEKIVSDSKISVMTNSQNSVINFNTFVLYAVNAEDICQNEESALEDCNPLTGEYEMVISTNDGTVVNTVPFSIIDSRA